MENVPQTFQYFMEAEVAAAEVLALKEEILTLHRRMNECREALAEVSKGGFDKGYMFEGSLLVRQTREDMVNKLKVQFKDLNEEIRAKGDEMKVKVHKLQDIEKQTPFPGRSLIPLDRAELQALGQVWGGHTS